MYSKFELANYKSHATHLSIVTQPSTLYLEYINTYTHICHKHATQPANVPAKQIVSQKKTIFHCNIVYSLLINIAVTPPLSAIVATLLKLMKIAWHPGRRTAVRCIHNSGTNGYMV